MDKQFIQLQVDPGISRLEILEGQALEPKAPRSIEIRGKIGAPAAWWKIKHENIDKDKCHVIVTEDSITLKINEDDAYTNSYVLGLLKIDAECSQWEINTDRFYNSKELARMIKANEFLFKGKEEWKAVHNALMRFETNVQMSIRDIKETSGDIDKALKVTLDNKVPKGFMLKTKVLGLSREEYWVDLGSELRGQEVSFYLDSSQLALLISEQKNASLVSYTKIFKDAGVAIIYT